MLSYFNELPVRVKIIDGLLAKSRKGEIEIYTSNLSIVEVAFAAREQTTRSIDEAVEKRLDEFWADREAIKLIEKGFNKFKPEMPFDICEPYEPQTELDL